MIMSKQKNKKRSIRIGDITIRVTSKSIKFTDLYNEFEFATTKVGDKHYIFESSSGYVIGQGENYTRARNNSKEFLNRTNGRFSELVNHFYNPPNK
jgi:hypothetical protein